MYIPQEGNLILQAFMTIRKARLENRLSNSAPADKGRRIFVRSQKYLLKVVF